MSEPRLKTLKEAIMPNETYGANEFTAEELEELFREEFEQETPPADETVSQQSEQTDADTSEGDKKDTSDTTKAFAKRLKESTEKARREERENIAKSLGYESYDDMQKKRENKLYEDKGLDPEDVSPIVDEIVKQRLQNDPRMQELETLRTKQLQEFGRKELEEIKKLTNGEITSLAQLPKEVIDLWKTKGSLKSAYLELEGEKLINKIRGEQSRGSTNHLQNPTGATPQQQKTRPLTAEEKAIWRQIHPHMSEEELNKKQVNI